MCNYYLSILGISVVVPIVVGVVALALGAGLGTILYKQMLSAKLGKAKATAVHIIEEALSEAKTLKKEAIFEIKEETHKIREENEKEIRERRSEVQRVEDRITQKEIFINKKEETLEKKQDHIDELKSELENEQVKIEEIKIELSKQQNKFIAELENVSKLSREEAKKILIDNISEEAKRDATTLIKKIESDAKEEANKKAQEIVTLAIQKCAVDQTSEVTVSVVPLPSDEMKGRIIGREGRNIRALESATGVDLIIDDTPEAITLSGFDPVRREIARISLEKLILDGRIHPARIEEIVEKVRKDIETGMKESGEQAVYDAEITGLHPELIKLLGRLKYRTSYGQNVLNHSLEVCYLAGLMASEIGADVKIAKRGGILHDIGKAVDHEVEGTHVSIGVDLATKYNENPAVVHCIAAHHGDVEFNSVEAILVQVADAISSSRPGARRESLENYIKRLKKLEEIACSFKGVETAFAIQAGREVRIIVKPEEITDKLAVFMAKDIAKRIEDEMQYPGQIKVNVIRESRCIEYAK
ncbi:MAG: ribonuclease Y [Clostridia bacterium]|jgi:ribonuclease Y